MLEVVLRCVLGDGVVLFDPLHVSFCLRDVVLSYMRSLSG